MRTTLHAGCVRRFELRGSDQQYEFINQFINEFIDQLDDQCRIEHGDRAGCTYLFLL